MRSTGLAVTLLISALALMACDYRTSPSNLPPALSAMPRGNPVTEFQPGVEDSAAQPSNRPEETELVIADGQRLYHHFNCSGCHASGGGAIGPALMDDEWIYGNSAGNIFWTIIEGRPQGMPAFGGRISEEQVWSLVAYVRSLSNLKDPPPAVPAEGDSVLRGRQVFLEGPCSLCHTIRGTSALATVGPDLTHVASRKTLVGGLPNTRGNLAGWILNPQNIEPETTMPPTPLAPQELHDLLDYLATLE
ncbi:MAG TPA: c-type cytochrome [Terriglobia bacterium]|nr:c-type cytochrome [Terriglobia bacterium]